jgi:hypothetical protein
MFDVILQPRSRNPRPIPLLVVATMLILLMGLSTACQESDSRGSKGNETPTGSLVERFEAALDEKDLLTRHLAMAEIFTDITEENFGDIRAVMEEDVSRLSPAEVRILSRMWGNYDRENALTDALQWPNRMSRSLAAAEILATWVEVDNGAAVLRTFNEMKESEGLSPEAIAAGEIALVEALGRHGDDDLVLEILMGLEESDHRKMLVTTALRGINGRKPGDFRIFAERTLKNDAVEESLQSEIALVALRFVHLGGPERSTKWYAEHLADGPHSSASLIAISEAWAREDPEAALTYLQSRPESEDPGMAKRMAALLWLQSDPSTAAPILRKAIDDDPGMEMAIFTLVQYLIAHDLDEAMELAQRVPDLAEREIVLKQGLVKMVRKDRPAADLYLANNEVPKSVRDAVRLAKRLRTTTTSVGDEGTQ